MVSVKVGDLLRSHPQYLGLGLDATVAAICGNVMFLRTGAGGLRPELIDPWPAAYLPPAGNDDATPDAVVFTWTYAGRRLQVSRSGRYRVDGYPWLSPVGDTAALAYAVAKLALLEPTNG